MGDVRIVVALCALLQTYLQTQPALARESVWVLNNLTGWNSLLQSHLISAESQTHTSALILVLLCESVLCTLWLFGLGTEWV